jgi:hypothetical protein
MDPFYSRCLCSKALQSILCSCLKSIHLEKGCIDDVEDMHVIELGVAIQACMAGIVFAKLARPKKRARTVSFSKTAVISLVNGKLR